MAVVSTPLPHQEPLMALYLVPRDTTPSQPGTGVACRCCPAGSRSTRGRRYPSDMTGAEWAVIEPLLAGRGPAPTAAIIDSQSVKAADTVAKDSRGYDAGKKIEGRKRHLAVDVMGLILCVVVTAASVQDRDGARPLLWRLAAGYRAVTLIWADGGYTGKLVTWAAGTLHRTLQIVKRPDDLHTFKVLPRRWVVERTFGW